MSAADCGPIVDLPVRHRDMVSCFTPSQEANVTPLQPIASIADLSSLGLKIDITSIQYRAHVYYSCDDVKAVLVQWRQNCRNVTLQALSSPTLVDGLWRGWCCGVDGHAGQCW